MVWAWMVLVILGWLGLDGSCNSWMVGFGWFLSFLDGLDFIGSCHSWMVWAWMVLIILGWLVLIDSCNSWMVWAWMVLFVVLGWFGLDWFLSFLDGLGLDGSFCHSWMILA
jgi:hypothetical protein